MDHERIADDDYRRLFELRRDLRRFLRWSEEQATRSGMTPARHQLLLAIRGLGGRPGPTVGELAEALLLRHHSTVELIDRAEEAGFVRRRRDPADARVVRLELTDRGRRRLETLTAVHVEELARLSRSLRPLLDGLGDASVTLTTKNGTGPSPRALGGISGTRAPGPG